MDTRERVIRLITESFDTTFGDQEVLAEKLDSLDIVELTMVLEEEFDIEIDEDNDFTDETTLEQLVALIDRKKTA